MRFELAIALRHLTSRKVRSGLISVITLISIVGVTIGVTALITVIAVMDGAQQDYMKLLTDELSHIEIRSVYGEKLGNYQAIMKLCETDPEVVGASPRLQTWGLIKRDTKYTDMEASAPAMILGLDVAREDKVTLATATNAERKVAGKTEPGPDEIIIGTGIVKRTGVGLGSKVFALTGKIAQTGNMPKPKIYPLTVAGIRDTGLSELDEFFACVSIKTAQEMTLLDDDVVDLVHIKLKDPFKADEVAARLGKRIQEELGIPTQTRSWGEMNPGLFKALALEKLAMFVILLLIVAVAGLNIMGTLILITMEKTREIGILRAMGTPRRSITKVFLAEGLFIGVIGTTLGIIFGLVLCYILKYHCPVDIPEDVYNLRGIPVKIKPLTVLTISASSIAICLISSVIPALLAARLKVVEALRYE